MLETFQFKICVNKSFFSLLNLSRLFLSIILHSNFPPRWYCVRYFPAMILNYIILLMHRSIPSFKISLQGTQLAHPRTRFNGQFLCKRQNQGRDFLLIDQALKLVNLVDLFFWAVRQWKWTLPIKNACIPLERLDTSFSTLAGKGSNTPTSRQRKQSNARGFSG